MARKPAELRPIMTRLPEALRHQLEKTAAENGRSMNAEIIHRLERSFAKDDRAALVQDAADTTATIVVNSLRSWMIEDASGRKWMIDRKKLRRKP